MPPFFLLIAYCGYVYYYDTVLVKTNKINYYITGVGMDNQVDGQQPISDDQELAKVLAGINQEVGTDNPQPQAVDSPVSPSMQNSSAIETPAPEPETQTPAPSMAELEESLAKVGNQVESLPAANNSNENSSNELDSIKQAALGDLRPLVDRLHISPEEKFDTYLLLLRSTDDKELVEPAYMAAKAIEDEDKRAEALLDVIKEIDFLSGEQQQ